MKAVCLVLVFVLAVPALAAADPFTEFRIPSHHWRSGASTFSASGLNSFFWGQAETVERDLSGRAAGSWAQGWDSDALRIRLGAGVGGVVDSRSADQRIMYFPGAQSIEKGYRRRAMGQWTLGSWLHAYPFGSPLGFALGGVVAGSHQRERYAADGAIGAPPADGVWSHDGIDEHFESLRANIAVGAGWGRVRDATVVYDAHVMEERLRDAGALTRSLSSAARGRLAALLAVSPAYSVAHERPDRFVWRDIEGILRDDGALADGGLDAYAVMKAREDYRFRGFRRALGWFVGPVLSASHQRDGHRVDHESSYLSYSGGSLVYSDRSVWTERYDGDDDRIWAGGQAEYHRPLGWIGQVDASASASTPVRPGDSGLQTGFNGSASWFVAERWSVTPALWGSRSYFAPRGAHDRLQRDSWNLSCGVTLDFHIEDRLSLGLALADQQMRYRILDPWIPGSQRAFRHDSEIELVLNYAFLGRVEAPGLIDPVTPVH